MTQKSTVAGALSARLFTAPGCPHCNGMKIILQQLLHEKDIEHLDIVDITQQPELANELGIRSVPWLEIGPLTFTGEQSMKDLRLWIVRLGDPESMADYYQKLLTDGELAAAESMLKKNPDTLLSLLTLIVRDELPLQVRIGVVAVFEGVSGSSQLQELIPKMGLQLTHDDYRVRADIAYLMGLTGSKTAISPLRSALLDQHPEVREIAADALEELADLETI